MTRERGWDTRDFVCCKVRLIMASLVGESSASSSESEGLSRAEIVIWNFLFLVSAAT